MQQSLPGGDNPRWGCAAGDLQLRIWDEDAVVFHGPGCATHLVSPGAATVLQALCQATGPQGAADLWRLAFGDDPGDDELFLLNGILARLAQSGLVTATHP